MSGILRAIHRCDADVTVAIDGYTTAPGTAPGARPAMTATFCAPHRANAAPWRTLRTVDRPSSPAEGRCGRVRDFREPKTTIQAHADDWLRDLSGLDPANHPDWATYLTAVHRGLCTRYGLDPEDTDGGAIGWIGVAAMELAANESEQTWAVENAVIFLGDAEMLAAVGLIDDAPGQCC